MPTPVKRDAGYIVIAVVLVAYGIYRALYIPPLLVGPPMPLLVVGFVAQAVLGVLAGVSVWAGAGAAALLVVLLGATVAATALIESFVLGIIPYLRALLEAVVAVVLALLVAGYLGARPARAV
jgi:hypothetical protein